MSGKNLPRVADYSDLRQEVTERLQGKVKWIMQGKGLSIRAVAKRGGLPYTVVFDVIHKASDPKLSTLHRLAYGLGVTFEELVS